MRLSIVLGTRPEIVKMSPVIRACEDMAISFSILHTGQHYSYNMDRVFFEQLGLPDATYNLDVGSGSHAQQTGKILEGVEQFLRREQPEIVLVEGDTNTVLAGALAATKLGIEVGHVEAGLRSYDKRMPEEINRVLVDHCSDYLFAPTEKSRGNLTREGLQAKTFVVGNTVVDAVFQNLEISKKNKNILERLDLEKGRYFLATAHRQENVDDATNLRGIVRGLELVRKEFGLDVVYPIHPRASRRLEEFGIGADGIRIIEPLDYLSFLQLESNARLVLTDSGGVQEEACVLSVPCLTLRGNTERPETLDVGANLLAGTNPQEILEKARVMLKKEMKWENPFGDGLAGKRIIEILKNNYRAPPIELKEMSVAGVS